MPDEVLIEHLVPSTPSGIKAYWIVRNESSVRALWPLEGHVAFRLEVYEHEDIARRAGRFDPRCAELAKIQRRAGHIPDNLIAMTITHTSFLQRKAREFLSLCDDIARYALADAMADFPLVDEQGRDSVLKGYDPYNRTGVSTVR